MSVASVSMPVQLNAWRGGADWHGQKHDHAHCQIDDLGDGNDAAGASRCPGAHPCLLGDAERRPGVSQDQVAADCNGVDLRRCRRNDLGRANAGFRHADGRAVRHARRRAHRPCPPAPICRCRLRRSQCIAARLSAAVRAELPGDRGRLYGRHRAAILCHGDGNAEFKGKLCRAFCSA